MESNDNSGFSNLLGSVPNQGVNPSKVPSVYNQIMSKIMAKKEVKIQAKIEVFDLGSLTDRQHYEELMLKISEKPDEFHYIQAKDHWTKEGDFRRAIDYVEITEKNVDKKKSEEETKPLSEDITKDLKEQLDSKHKELQDELTDEEKSKLDEETANDDKKIEDAVVESEIQAEESVRVEEAPEK